MREFPSYKNPLCLLNECDGAEVGIQGLIEGGTHAPRYGALESPHDPWCHSRVQELTTVPSEGSPSISRLNCRQWRPTGSLEESISFHSGFREPIFTLRRESALGGKRAKALGVPTHSLESSHGGK